MIKYRISAEVGDVDLCPTTKIKRRVKWKYAYARYDYISLMRSKIHYPDVNCSYAARVI